MFFRSSILSRMINTHIFRINEQTIYATKIYICLPYQFSYFLWLRINQPSICCNKLPNLINWLQEKIDLSIIRLFMIWLTWEPNYQSLNKGLGCTAPTSTMNQSVCLTCHFETRYIYNSSLSKYVKKSSMPIFFQ